MPKQGVCVDGNFRIGRIAILGLAAINFLSKTFPTSAFGTGNKRHRVSLSAIVQHKGRSAFPTDEHLFYFYSTLLTGTAQTGENRSSSVIHKNSCEMQS